MTIAKSYQEMQAYIDKESAVINLSTQSQNALSNQVKPMLPREAILQEARSIIMKDRNNAYGDPEDNFRQIAALWSAYKGVTFTSMDVALMCALIKFARLAKNPTHHDSLVDIAGYAGCGGDIQAALQRVEAARAQG